MKQIPNLKQEASKMATEVRSSSSETVVLTVEEIAKVVARKKAIREAWLLLALAVEVA